MIAGHIGVALGAKALKREAPFGWLLVASIAPDIVDVVWAAIRVCNPNELYSHSLPAIGVTALALAVAAFWWTRSASTALLVAALVVAHLAADFVTGYKLLWAHGPSVGLNLYRRPVLDFLVEFPIVAGGWWLLHRAGDAPRWATLRIVPVVLILAQAAGDLSTVFAPWLGKPNACGRHVVQSRRWN